MCAGLLLLPAAICRASSLIPASPVTHHYSISMLGSRVGTSTVTETAATFAGHPALRVDAVTDMKIVVLAAVEQKIDLREFIDAAGRPLTLSMTMSSGGHTTKVDARFSEKQVDCTVDSGGTKTDKAVAIPAGVSLVADPEQIGPKGTGTKLKPGVKLRLYTFEPMTLQIMPIDMEVLPPETLALGGKSYHATVIKTVTSLSGESKEWLDDQGELLQDESALGLKMVLEDGSAPSAPPTTAYVPPRDFAVATSIRTETVIPNPRTVSFLRLRVDGIPAENLVLSDARQSAQVQHEGDKISVVYTIRADTAEPRGEAAEPPVLDSSPSGHQVITPSGHQQYLAPAPYLEVDDPRIRDQAHQIVGDATDPLEKARRIRAWVHGHMKPEMDIGIVRGATDVLAHPVGVCRDYAVLFTALARAAGVPARVCGGIVYFRGSFYYHAWSEVAVPDPSPEHPTPNTQHLTWTPFDATLPTDFVDATHLKFAQGDPTAMFQAVRVVGQLKAQVLEYRSDRKS
jgi:transglutaminase-like putative cysteine protease